MKTLQQLHQMDEQELTQEVLTLQKMVTDMKICQSKSALIHNYHFAGEELLSCERERMLGSGVILAIYDLSGKIRVSPVMMKDGLSAESVNALLDDVQYSFDSATSFKPTQKRLNKTCK